MTGSREVRSGPVRSGLVRSGPLSESILIVSVHHRIYIDCFCARDLSDSILIVAVFQNHYRLFLSVTEFIFIVSVRARVMWTVVEATGLCERTWDGN